MNIWNLYWGTIPEPVRQCMDSPEMQRIKQVGMNCGCEYTSFPLFERIQEPYSRYDHSVGTALLVWRFTGDTAQTLAALFHDIASPCFAHVVDFMMGDYLNQESTEGRTREMIEQSRVIRLTLEQNGLGTDDVADYHMYPIADNDSPRLSADRLEYTLGNLVNYQMRTQEQVQHMVAALQIGEDEHGVPELTFQDMDAARDFAMGALEMGRVYVSDPDRFSMEKLAELLRDAVHAGVLTMEDLWRDEPYVIAKLCGDSVFKNRWEYYCGYYKIDRNAEDGIIIPAKKRYIDPLVSGRGRMSSIDSSFRQQVEEFLAESQNVLISARSRLDE